MPTQSCLLNERVIGTVLACLCQTHCAACVNVLDCAASMPNITKVADLSFSSLQRQRVHGWQCASHALADFSSASFALQVYIPRRWWRLTAATLLTALSPHSIRNVCTLVDQLMTSYACAFFPVSM